MKKNMMMRIASVLLIAVLMSTSAISGTYAKYVTAKEGSDTARVAKFGVEVTANGNMFADVYKYADTIAAEAGDETSVDSYDGADVVAPGTKGEMAKMTLNGTPEVDVKVTYDATVEINDKWAVNSTNYFPLVVKVNGTAVSYNATDDAADIAKAIEEAIEGYSKEYKANTDLTTVGADSVAVAWEWPFYISDENDVKDTALGNQATAGNAATIKLTVKTTVTQVD